VLLVHRLCQQRLLRRLVLFHLFHLFRLHQMMFLEDQ
jgi:hypothetical protein